MALVPRLHEREGMGNWVGRPQQQFDQGGTTMIQFVSGKPPSMVTTPGVASSLRGGAGTGNNSRVGLFTQGRCGYRDKICTGCAERESVCV
jgi:hypothetical protein